jgi:hypothetical protein
MREVRSGAATLALSAMLALAGCGSSGNDPPPATECDGFPMPNPAATGLPHPASYTANADGTVTDAVTGLTWEGAVDGKAYMEDEAVAHCAAKGGGWRLPTRLELVSLVDYSVASPRPTINPIFADTPTTTFWTASAYHGDVGDDWYVGFDAGYSDYGIQNQSDSVRCVRAGAPPRCFVSRYQPQPDGTVLDQATGLVWQQRLDPGSYDWSGAQAFCAGLGAGWRVPSLTEIQTIIDDHREYPAVDPAAFPDTPSVDFWTSSPKADGSSYWYVDFFYGSSDTEVSDELYRVRCVR